MKKINNKGFSHLEIGLLILVVVIISAVGFKLITRSHADSLTGYINFANYTNVKTDSFNNQKVFQSQDFLTGIGAQYISDISPGGKLVYNSYNGGNVSLSSINGYSVGLTSICYFIRAYNSPKSVTQVPNVQIQFVGKGNALTKSINTDNKYHQVCVPSGVSPQLNYNIYNESNDAYILVYQAILYY